MLARRLTDSLYVEAMVLADEARAYFDDAGRDGLDAFERVLFSCESLKVTTRLMHVIAWLLTQRAVQAGEIDADQARESARRLGPEIVSDDTALARLPGEASKLVAASADLYRRVALLDCGALETTLRTSPARHLHRRLQQAF